MSWTKRTSPKDCIQRLSRQACIVQSSKILIVSDTGNFIGGHVSLGALGDSFFELLLKSWLLTGKEDTQAYRMYKEASRAIQKKFWSCILAHTNNNFQNGFHFERKLDLSG
jgi:hypothetical protein